VKKKVKYKKLGGEKMKKRYLIIPMVMLAVLTLATFSTPASAGGYCDGCPFDNFYNGTLAHGGIYFDCKGWYDDPGVTENETFENVPDGREIVRFYPGIWTGSPTSGSDIHFSITINGNLTNFTYNNTGRSACSDDPACNITTSPQGCNISETGCGCDAVRYNDAASNITTGNNTIAFWTNEQIYQFALLTVYENASKPPIQYWVKEGHEYPDEGTPYYVYFNETANTGKIYLGSLKSADYWNYGYPHLFGTPELNGHDIGGPDIVRDNTYDNIFYGWLNIPADYVTASSNEFKYEGFYNARLMVAVLVLNYYEPSNLTVTDISSESLIANWSNAINAKIVNYGKTARFFNVTLYANDTKVDVKRVENLGEGENRTVKFFWKPNATGSYELNVTADVENVVNETDETNNSKTLDVTVTTANPPAWQSPSSNVSIIANSGTIELRAQGNATVGLHNATLATNESGTWTNCTSYGSPMNMASHYNPSVTHTSDSDWDNQTMYNLSIVNGDVRLGQYGTGSDNLALKKTNYSSSVYSTYTADKGNDGVNNLTHSWRSASGAEYMPCWWKVDLGDVKDVNKISFYGRTYCTPLKYKILISNDNETWTEKIVRYSTTTESVPDNYTLLSWSCRYINVTVTENDYGDGKEYGGLSELEAYPPLGYNPNGTLTSKTIETDNPIISVTPTWNATNSTNNSVSVNISVDNGATTTDKNETSLLHDISLNYTTKDPIESEWLWSNFTWHNDSITDKTVGWKIYYEDMLGQTNCTDVKIFHVGDYVYDFSTGAGTDKWAFRPETPATLSVNEPHINFTDAQYDNIKVDDDTNYRSDETETTNYYAAHRFNFSISENPDDISKINVTWNGKGWHDSNPGSTYDGANLYLWNGTGYEELANNSGDDDWVYLTGENESAASTYINSGNVTILVVQKSPDGGKKNSHIETDYVKLVITPE
jgi:hypothetical protein